MSKMNRMSKEDIVVSGISGRFPESDTVDEFMDNLYANINMVTHDEKRWPYGYQGLTSGLGKIKDVSQFDADFFGISENEANLMDNQVKIMLEITYEAICDAGIDPNHLGDTRTGLYIGISMDDFLCAQHDNFGEYRQQFAGSVSQIFNIEGPALTTDTACASSFTALTEAMVAIRNGLCDRALVISNCIGLRPAGHIETLKLNMTSSNGIPKCLDANADGYAKGEACAAILLQKKSDAKRNYGTIVHSKTNSDGFKENGITFPNYLAQRNLMSETYVEAGIDPLDVNFIDAHCTGTAAGDPVEMQAIVESMCSGRTNSLLIGALKSNIGHTEGTAGLCSLTKVLFSFENQCIPANINYQTPNPKIDGLKTGLLKPVIENMPFKEKLAALNCFGFGGVNCHLIVRSDSKDPTPENNEIFGGIPRLVLMCGRTEEGLNSSISQIVNTPKMLTRDYLSLLNEPSKASPFKEAKTGFEGMKYRGFGLIHNKTDSTEDSNKIFVSKVPETKRQVWFVFSGFGTQWSGMAESLMSLDVFSKSIGKSAQVLSEYNYDLMRVLIEPKGMECPLNTIVCLAAIQIALVDVLNELNIVADGFVGHSVGELGCAYADRCMSHEESIRVAYWRGWYVKSGVNSFKGEMAAVGMTLPELQRRLPSDVFASCYNSVNSITVSGNEKAVNCFLDQLKREDIFTRPVNSNGIAFHCPLMSSIREPLVSELFKVITSERKVTKWLSTTYDLSDEKAQFLTAEYMADNLIIPVRFSEALSRIPNNAIVFEVSPHMLFKSIIMKSLGSDVTYIPLMEKNENNIRILLESVGKLYTNGINANIENLYRKVEYPVSRGTPTISSVMKWDHNKSYNVYKFPEYYQQNTVNSLKVKINVQDEQHKHLTDHCLDGRILYPGTGYLMLAWKLLSKQLDVAYDKLPVEFQDVYFKRATILTKEAEAMLEVKIDESSGQFVVIESNSVAATGKIFALKIPCSSYTKLYASEMSNFRLDYNLIAKNCTETILNNSETRTQMNCVYMERNDFYKEMRLRGYDYGPEFQCLDNALVKSDRVEGFVQWKGHWEGFIDSVLQMTAFKRKSRDLYLPVRIESLKCDPNAMNSHISSTTGAKVLFPTVFDFYLDSGATVGLEFRGLVTNLGTRKVFSPMPNLESLEFLAYEGKSQIKSADKQFLKDYINRCNILAIDLAKEFNLSLNDLTTFDKNIENLVQEEINDILDVKLDENNSQWLMKALIDIRDSKLKNNAIKEIGLDLDKDVLNQCFPKKYFLRPLIETVVENLVLFNKKLDVLEVSQSNAIIAQTVTELIGLTSFDSDINYNLVHPMSEILEDEHDDNIKHYDWQFNASKLPDNLRNLDLIIYQDKIDSLSKFKVDLSQMFESIAKSLKKQSFLIVFYKNELNFAEEVFLNILFDTQNDDNNNRRRITKDLFIDRKNQMISEALKFGLTLIATKTDGISTGALVFRKLNPEVKVEEQTFIRITNDRCEKWIERLKNSLITITDRPETENIWLIGNDSPSNGVVGFANCLRKEPNGHRIRCILQCEGNGISDILQNRELLASIVKKNLFMNVLMSDSIWGAFRRVSIHSDDNCVPSEHCYLNVQTRGDLSSFKWFEANHKYWPLGKENNQGLIKVFYSALNFKDVMLATGKLSVAQVSNDLFNDCVLGMEFSGIDESGQRVFGMTPNNGLATTIVASKSDTIWPVPDHWSMEEAATIPVVYATTYLALIIRGKLKPRESVLIHSGSGGVGLAAIALCLSMDCKLFITCGSDSKRDFLKQEFSPKLTDKNFWTSRDISFESFVMRETNGRGVDVVLNSLAEDKLRASVRCLATSGRFLEIGKFDIMQNNDLDLTSLFKNKSFYGIALDTIPFALYRLLYQLVSDGIRDGVVRPLKRTVFDSAQVEEAFRYMASGKHMGKVILKIRDENSTPSPFRSPIVRRTFFKPNKSYIITGGLGGLGLELANWMIRRGAVNLVLTSRSGLKTHYQRFRIKHFEDLGINVNISTEDVSDLSQTRDLIQMSAHMGCAEGVGGVFNLAMVLADSLFENQTTEQFERVLAPKSLAVHNMDLITRELCPDLEHFVCFSSVSSALGNAGQTNYGLANSIMDRICQQRKAHGLPGQAIAWGLVGDVGVAAEMMGNDVVIAGTLPQRIPSCLAALDILMQTDHSVVLSYVKAEHSSVKQSKRGNLVESIGIILGLKEYKSLASNTPLSELGIDSLMIIEVKQILELNYNTFIDVQEIRALTIENLLDIDHNFNGTDPKSVNNAIYHAHDYLKFEIPEESITFLNDIKEGKPLLLLPPMDGSFRLLTNLVELLKRPVIGLNWTEECQNLKTFEEAVNYYLNLIDEKLKDQFGDSYDIMGYCFGGSIAYEMAVQFERTSKCNPKLILLDASPYLVGTFLQMLADKYDFKTELDRFIGIFNLFVPMDFKAVEKSLENFPTDQKFSEFLRMSFRLLNMETNDKNIELVANVLRNKVIMYDHYDVDHVAKFNGDCLLIRSKESLAKINDILTLDYGLKNLINGKFDTFVMDGMHVGFIDDNTQEIARLTNEFLQD